MAFRGGGVIRQIRELWKEFRQFGVEEKQSVSDLVRREQMKQTALLASLKNMNESDEIEKFLKSQTEALQTISKRIDEETVKVQNALSGLDVSLNPQLTEVEVSKSVHAVEPVIESSFSNNTDINKKDK